mmetsp:Transcript_59514/g.128745  ORF Transcript_59514/g.128745 Transcript_59514/m.128745 type:complete len:297 (+) Transcript_59514:1073-1963(+)
MQIIILQHHPVQGSFRILLCMALLRKLNQQSTRVCAPSCVTALHPPSVEGVQVFLESFEDLGQGHSFEIAGRPVRCDAHVLRSRQELPSLRLHQTRALVGALLQDFLQHFSDPPLQSNSKGWGTLSALTLREQPQAYARHTTEVEHRHDAGALKLLLAVSLHCTQIESRHVCHDSLDQVPGSRPHEVPVHELRRDQKLPQVFHIACCCFGILGLCHGLDEHINLQSPGRSPTEVLPHREVINTPTTGRRLLRPRLSATTLLRLGLEGTRHEAYALVEGLRKLRDQLLRRTLKDAVQ